MLGDVPIIINNGLSTWREVEVTYKGHPFVQWLSRYIPFDPDVHATVLKFDPMIFQTSRGLHMSAEAARCLKERLASS